MLTGFDVFDRTVQKSLLWLDELAHDLGGDRHGAYRALRAVFHALRDRLVPTEAIELSAQLPMLLRGLYFEGWVPSERPVKIKQPALLIELVRRELGPSSSPEHAYATIEAVFRLLDRHLSAGELDAVRRALPHGIRALWPDVAASRPS
jgi:uncharacterized protein (DUF2267 family)